METGTPITDKAESNYDVWKRLCRSSTDAARKAAYSKPAPDGWETARFLESCLIILMAYYKIPPEEFNEIIGKIKDAADHGTDKAIAVISGGQTGRT